MNKLKWKSQPECEGRYLWRLGAESDIYQMCYVVNGLMFATSAQLLSGGVNKVWHDGISPDTIGGEWLFLTPRLFVLER